MPGINLQEIALDEERQELIVERGGLAPGLHRIRLASLFDRLGGGWRVGQQDGLGVLLAVDDVIVALAARRGLQRGEVGAGARFGVALAPAQLALHDTVDGIQESSHGKLGDIVGLGGGLRVRIEVGVVLSGRLGYHLDVGALVDHLDLFVKGDPGLHLHEFPCHFGTFEHLVDGFESLGGFGVVMARLVTEVPVILYDSSCRSHKSLPSKG